MSETAGGSYTEELFSMGVWMGERERDQAAGSGAHYLHGNLYHWEKKKNLSVRQASRHSFMDTEEELQYTQTPTKSSVVI